MSVMCRDISIDNNVNKVLRVTLELTDIQVNQHTGVLCFNVDHWTLKFQDQRTDCFTNALFLFYNNYWQFQQKKLNYVFQLPITYCNKLGVGHFMLMMMKFVNVWSLYVILFNPWNVTVSDGVDSSRPLGIWR